jgi:hypothetical protein
MRRSTCIFYRTGKRDALAEHRATIKEPAPGDRARAANARQRLASSGELAAIKRGTGSKLSLSPTFSVVLSPLAKELRFAATSPSKLVPLNGPADGGVRPSAFTRPLA